MAGSTGPVIATGAITWTNAVILSSRKPADVLGYSARVAVGTGIAAMILSGVDKLSPQAARAVGYLALLTVTLTRIGGRPSPVENTLSWWNSGGN
jgi:hypothetical protein